MSCSQLVVESWVYRLRPLLEPLPLIFYSKVYITDNFEFWEKSCNFQTVCNLKKKSFFSKLVWTIFTNSPFKIGDIGDVRANLYNTPKACEEITQQYRKIFKNNPQTFFFNRYIFSYSGKRIFFRLMNMLSNLWFVLFNNHNFTKL